MIRFFVIFYCFIIVSVMAVIGFVDASTFPQLISAILFFPLTAYFWFLVFPKGTKAVTSPSVKSLPTKAKKNIKEEPIVLSELPPNKAKFDSDKRMFIKLIGSVGLSLFFLSIFSRKAEAAFFGSVPGPGTVAIKDTTGTQIDPAIKSPTDGYKITNIDDAGSPAYYGFVDKTGRWFIMSEDSTGAFRYTKGSSNFPANWTNRSSLTYDYFNVIFA